MPKICVDSHFAARLASMGIFTYGRSSDESVIASSLFDVCWAINQSIKHKQGNSLVLAKDSWRSYLWPVWPVWSAWPAISQRNPWSLCLIFSPTQNGLFRNNVRKTCLRAPTGFTPDFYLFVTTIKLLQFKTYKILSAIAITINSSSTWWSLLKITDIN